MQVSDKLIKPLTEAKYLNANNVSRYRCIMRIFFEHYEKLKYWLYQEEVYEEMIQDPLFADYRPEQCQQDLTMLTGNPHAFDNGTAAGNFLYQMIQMDLEIREIKIESSEIFPAYTPSSARAYRPDAARRAGAACRRYSSALRAAAPYR